MTISDDARAVTIEDLPADVLNAAVRRLDAPSLASASCAASGLRSAANDPDLWRGLCVATWPSLRLLPVPPPSLPRSHRSFFADAFPSPASPSLASAGLPANLISAVDLYYRGTHILSRVVRTETSSPWFQSAPFRVDALDWKVAPAPPSSEQPPAAVSPEELALTWVLIEPEGGRAADLSSRSPVAVDRRWYSAETQVRFAAVVGEEFAVTAVVTWSESAGQVREVGLVVEGADGVGLSGRGGLAVLGAALNGGRRMAAEGDAARRYEEFDQRRRRRREMKERGEGAAELGCAAVVAGIVLAFFVLVAFP